MALNHREPYFDTAIDDLESFVWVLLYAGLLIAESRGPLNTAETNWLSYQLSQNAKEQLAKTTIAREIARRATSPVLLVFAPLVKAWYRLSVEARDRVSDALNRPRHPSEAYCKKVYQQYLQIGFSHLQNLPETWDEIVVPERPWASGRTKTKANTNEENQRGECQSSQYGCDQGTCAKSRSPSSP